MDTNAPNVYAAINAVQAELSKDGISKHNRNQQQGYNFRGIDDVYNSLSSYLAKHNLVIIPRVIARDQVERTTAKGGALFYTSLDVEFDFISAVDGSRHTARAAGEAMDSGDKSTNKAMSAAYKYVCMQVFCIPTVGDNDADATMHEVASQKSANPTPQQIKRSAGFVAQINAAKSSVELVKIGGQLGGADLTESQLGELRGLYAQKNKALKAAGEQSVAA